MPDVLERQLAARLLELADATGDGELVPPADLELQIARRRARTSAGRRWTGASVAAVLAVVVAMVAVVHGTSGTRSVAVSAPSTTVPAAARDPLPAGTVMLAAKGRDVLALDARGHQIATMVHAVRGDIQYARVTADHRELWYLSRKHGTSACADVVRADIEGRSSMIVTHAVAFDISPDGTRLALYGAGDLAHDRCEPVRTRAGGALVVVDIATGAASALELDSAGGLRWTSDATAIDVLSCLADGCAPSARVAVPHLLDQPLRVEGFVPTRPPFPASAAGWKISQVVDTDAGTFVVAVPPGTGRPALYRIDAGRLVVLRDLDPGMLSAVGSLPG